MKYIVLIGLMLYIGVGWISPLPNPAYTNANTQQELVKEKAFEVLKQKCNTCHATRKRVSIFTFENMDSLSTSIKEQVFNKQKMPKGRKNALSEREKEQLKHWLAGL